MLSKLSSMLAIFGVAALLSNTAQAQTQLIPASDGGFEGAYPNGWTEAGYGTGREWQFGDAAGSVAPGTQSAYVGAAANYNGANKVRVGHFYRDIAIPAGATQVYLNYQLQIPTIDNSSDFFYIYTNTTAQTPVAGTLPAGTQRRAYTTPAIADFAAQPQIDLTALAGTTVRLVFTFKSDASTPFANPAVDNITLSYVPPSCTNATAFPTAFAAPAPGAGAYTISTTQKQSEYNSMTGATAGHTFTSTGSIAGTYITVRAGTYNGTLVAAGTTPLNWTATAGGSYFIHYNTNSSCGTAATNMTSKITNTTFVPTGCTNTTAYPTGSFAAPAQGAGAYTITTAQYQQEYNSMTGAVAGNTFSSTGSIAGTFITVHAGTYNGTVVAFGTTPLAWTATAGGSYFIHYNTNSACGTASTLMTTAITNTTPIVSCSGTPTAGSITGTSPICAGTGTTLTLGGSTTGAGVTRQWKSSTTSGGPYTNLGTALTQATGNLSQTTYYVVAVTCTTGPATSTTAEYTVVVNPIPTATITAGGPTTFCGGGSVTLTSSAGSTYLWSPAC